MFEILANLGSSSESTVYKAREIASKRIVALKIAHAAADISIAARRLLREGYTLGYCNGPGVLELFYTGELEQRPFLAMELAQGKLRDCMHLPLSARQAASTVETLAQVADFLHGRGVIHRAINLQHVYLSLHGEVKLGGFGLASNSNDITSETSRTDLVGLGVMLFELLTGEMLGESSRTAGLAIEVSSLLPADVPDELRTICLSCLEIDHTRRYVSAGAIADDLEKWLKSCPPR